MAAPRLQEENALCQTALLSSLQLTGEGNP